MKWVLHGKANRVLERMKICMVIGRSDIYYVIRFGPIREWVTVLVMDKIILKILNRTSEI